MFWWAGRLPTKVVHFDQISTCCFMAPGRPQSGPGSVYWPHIIKSLLQNLSMTFVTPESYVPWIVALKPKKKKHSHIWKQEERCGVPRRTITASWTCVVRVRRVVPKVERGKLQAGKRLSTCYYVYTCRLKLTTSTDLQICRAFLIVL